MFLKVCNQIGKIHKCCRSIQGYSYIDQSLHHRVWNLNHQGCKDRSLECNFMNHFLSFWVAVKKLTWARFTRTFLLFGLSKFIISANSGPAQGTNVITFSVAFWPRRPFSQQFFWITWLKVIKRHRFSSNIANFTKPFVKWFNAFGASLAASRPFAPFSPLARPLSLGRGCKKPKENKRKNFAIQHTETYWFVFYIMELTVWKI